MRSCRFGAFLFNILMNSFSIRIQLNVRQSLFKKFVQFFSNFWKWFHLFLWYNHFFLDLNFSHVCHWLVLFVSKRGRIFINANRVCLFRILFILLAIILLECQNPWAYEIKHGKYSHSEYLSINSLVLKKTFSNIPILTFDVYLEVT